MANEKRIALRNVLTNLGSLKSISVGNSENDKSIRVSYKDSNSTINIPVDLIPEEIIKKQKGRFHFSITGKLGEVKNKSVSVKITDYSVSLYDEPEVKEASPG